MVPVKTNSNWLPSIFNDFFENEWLAKTGLVVIFKWKYIFKCSFRFFHY